MREVPRDRGFATHLLLLVLSSACTPSAPAEDADPLSAQAELDAKVAQGKDAPPPPEIPKVEGVSHFLLDFRGANWIEVQKAKAQLEALELDGARALASLLNDPDYRPLENTADLIYPGARHFYGHGWALPYDLDFVRVRAGWVLEEMAMRSFGFADGRVVEHTEVLGAPTPNEPPRFPELAAIAARRWVAELPEGWTRLQELDRLLHDDADPQAVQRAVAIVGAVPTYPGFDRTWYETHAKERVEQLARSSTHPARDAAIKALAAISDPYWQRKIDRAQTPSSP